MAEGSDTALAPIGSVRRTRVGREATEPMREDIRLLGAILGDTVREQNGEEVFDLVERARVESFRVRRSEIDRAELAGLFDGIDIHQAIPVIRAFTHFALLANVAEDIHRERRRAVHVAAGEPPQNSSLAATYLKLDSAELDSATVADALTGALVSPVITAHPTETRRRTVFDTQHRITELMRLRLHGHTQTEDGRDIERELRRHILTLWQTALIRLSRLKIQDEIETGLRYYPAAFFDVIPQVNAEVRDALRARWPDAHLLDEPILRPGSWIGGDRDGNPNVTADVVRLATGRAAYTALEHYFTEITALEQELSMSARLVKVSDELAALADACDEPARADEPYRRALRVIHGRLTATAAEILDRQPEHELDLGLQRYATPAELLADLDIVDASLRANGSAVLADDRLARLREAVRVFGFHLSGLDMRQNSDVHEEVVAELLAWAGVHPDYRSLPEPDRVELLVAELATRRPLVGEGAELSELARKELDIVAAAARAVRVFGPQAVPNYIISMCQSVSDMLEAAILLKEAGLLDASGTRALRARSGSCRCSRPSTTCSADRRFSKRRWTFRCTAAWCPPAATARKSCSATPTPTRTAATWPRTGRCTGPSWTWSSRRARPESGCGSSTVAAAPWAAAAGPSYDAILAQPPGAVKGSLRITEQGEVIAAKYAEPRIAHRNLETLVAATLESTLLDVEGLGEAAGPAYEVLDDLAARAQRAYAELVHETPGFVEYFKASTPVSEIGALNIGSRPTSRKPTTSISDLRAIPWVLAWSQSRVMLPGWYGTGSAFEEWIAEGDGRLEVLRDLYVRWPFFSTVLSNMAQVLAKSDMGLAARYSELVEDETLRRACFRQDRRRTRTHDQDVQADHRPGRPARRQPGAGPVGVQPVPVPGTAQPPAGRAAAAVPLR